MSCLCIYECFYVLFTWVRTLWREIFPLVDKELVHVSLPFRKGEGERLREFEKRSVASRVSPA